MFDLGNSYTTPKYDRHNTYHQDTYLLNLDLHPCIFYENDQLNPYKCDSQIEKVFLVIYHHRKIYGKMLTK